MLSSQQSDCAYTSAFHEPDPKSQRETRASPHAEQWKQAEEIEIKMLWGMVKCDSDGNISKYKASWCARGDMQMPWEYKNTYSPTSHFAAVLTMIATAAQEGMELHHWDIQ
eukprot:3938330-Rhodomonas_salina.1